MKTRNFLRRATLWTALSLACGSAALNAQSAPGAIPQTGPVRFSGSAVKTESIVASCDAIVVGEVTEPGTSQDQPESPWTVYSGIGVKISQILRGSVDHQIDVTLSTMRSQSFQEIPPTFEDSYIFFINKTDTGSDPYQVIKVLPATDENIAVVKKLIAALPPTPSTPAAP